MRSLYDSIRSKKKQRKRIQKNRKKPLKHKKLSKRKKQVSKKTQKGGGILPIQNPPCFINEDNKDRDKKENKDVSICKINNIEDFEPIVLDKYVNSMKSLNITLPEQQEHYIIPYCGENIKGIEFLGKHEANKNEISDKLTKAITKKLQIEFIISNKIKKNDNENERVYHSISNEILFLDYLKNILCNDLEKRDKDGMLIVSHSNFLVNFTNLISNEDTSKVNEEECVKTPETGNRILFKNNTCVCNRYNSLYNYANLDILMLQFKKEEEEWKLSTARIFRWFDNYKSPIEDENIETANKNVKTIYLMRHCVACHNLKPVDKQIKHGYGKWSNCINETIDELNDKKDGLNILIVKYSGGLKKTEFGSSIILRAILTSILCKFILLNDNYTSNNK